MADTSGAHKSESELHQIRRHVRILVDLGRVAGESGDQNRFLDQVVVHVARAVEIDHVKVLRYRTREADLLVAAGFGWKEGVVRVATLSADLRSPPGRSFQTAQPVHIKDFGEQDDLILSDHVTRLACHAQSSVPPTSVRGRDPGADLCESKHRRHCARRATSPVAYPCRAGRFQVWSSNLFLLPFFGVLLPVQVARCSVCASLFCPRTSTRLYNAVNEPHAKQDRANNLHEGKQA
jgi:hypothetical protein